MADASTSSSGLGDLVSGYVQDNARLWQQYATRVQKLAERTAAAFTARPAGAPPPDLTTAGRELVQLGLDHYTEVLTTYADYVTRGLSAAVRSTIGTQAPAPPAASPAAPPPPTAQAAPPAAPAPGPKIRLVFAGPATEAVSESFAIANKQSCDVEVAFELSEFVPEAGASASRARLPVAFSPEHFVLLPGEEQVVQCRVPLGAPLVPGTRYLAVVRIAGMPGMEIALVAEPAAPASPPTASSSSTVSSTGAVTPATTGKATTSAAGKGRTSPKRGAVSTGGAPRKTGAAKSKGTHVAGPGSPRRRRSR